MKCPHCSQEIPGVSCPECHKVVPTESKYCLYCGTILEDTSTTESDTYNTGQGDDFDFENRIPCRDGNCIGIVINGRCNICGKFHKGKKK